ncbi:alpha/beta-gliadin A-II-like [Arachis stenosperma]|uniref:alpha/beta-gliadin A-II-like n=1 Tax=Arachis stenosperma TaxID=217475 RepID=UPI0025AD93FB|nr:alpha/beta-gliadin A-II-like [Arachis stenosperma]
MKLGASHNIVLAGPKNKNWGIEHVVWISQWLNSSMCVLTGEHVDNYQPSNQYMDWYIGKFGDHLRVSEVAEQEEEGQQEQLYQQEQPPQQQGPPRQEQLLVSQSYAYAPYPYLPYQQPYPYPAQHPYSQYLQEYANFSTQPFIQPPYSQPYPYYPPPPYTQEYTQSFIHPLYGQLSTMCEAYRPT